MVFARIPPRSLWNNGTVPAVASANDPSTIELGVKFRADVSGKVTGIRYYKGSLNAGSHTATLWTSSGVQLATATFTNETASGWQEVLFATPVDVTANTTYVASYHAPNGGYAVTIGDFSRSQDSGPLHAPSSGSSGGNGLYKYGPSAFPTETFKDTNYWVDVLFEPNE